MVAQPSIEVFNEEPTEITAADIYFYIVRFAGSLGNKGMFGQLLRTAYHLYTNKPTPSADELILQTQDRELIYQLNQIMLHLLAAQEMGLQEHGIFPHSDTDVFSSQQNDALLWKLGVLGWRYIGTQRANDTPGYNRQQDDLSLWYAEALTASIHDGIGDKNDLLDGEEGEDRELHYAAYRYMMNEDHTPLPLLASANIF